MTRPYEKHGDGTPHSRLYNAYKGMKARCNNPSSKDYSRYGGRGITIADEFGTFAKYRRWFQHTFGIDDIPAGLTLDRTNNNDNYAPDNMRLATQKTQGNNRRTNKLLTFQGTTRTISEWADTAGIPRKTLEKRVSKYGWTVERALTTPVNAHHERLTFRGETHSVKKWADISGLNCSTIHHRLDNGWTVEDALTVPARKHTSTLAK